jgi:hypothetical protein
MKPLIVALLALALTGNAASAATTFENGPLAMAVSATHALAALAAGGTARRCLTRPLRTPNP